MQSKDLLVGFHAEKELHSSPTDIEHECGAVEPVVLCCVHKLHEMWNGKREWLGDFNLELLEVRGDDVTNNCFYVSANAFEPKLAKVRKGDLCGRARGAPYIGIPELGVYITSKTKNYAN
jgi:hypothetical protein